MPNLVTLFRFLGITERDLGFFSLFINFAEIRIISNDNNNDKLWKFFPNIWVKKKDLDKVINNCTFINAERMGRNEQLVREAEIKSPVITV